LIEVELIKTRDSDDVIARVPRHVKRFFAKIHLIHVRNRLPVDCSGSDRRIGFAIRFALSDSTRAFGIGFGGDRSVG